MTKKVFERLKIVAVALSLAGAAAGCSNTSNDDVVDSGAVGAIGLNLKLPNGSTVDPITYTITGPTMTTGTIPADGTGTTFSVKIDNLKPGSGYTITLAGKQSNGAKDCFGSQTFTVTANMTTSVKVSLSCPGVRKGGTGSIMVDGTINICATVDSASGSPSADGTTIMLSGSGSDEDTLPSNMIKYKWTAPAGSGTFASDSSAFTTFACATTGAVTLTLTDTDGDCGDMMDVMVQCKAGTGGTGGSGGAGGTGGTTAGTGGTTAGTGGTTAGTGGTTAGTGGTTAGTGGTTAGTGGTTAGTGGTTAGTGGTTAGTGGSTGGTGGSTGGTGGSTAGTGGSTGGPTTAECRACENMTPACMTRAADLESSPKRALAEAVIACVRTKKCSFKSGEFSLVDCWCGPPGDAQDACVAGTTPFPGDCKAEIEAAAETTSAVDVAARMTDPSFGVGLAYNVMICEGSVCPPPVCEL